MLRPLMTSSVQPGCPVSGEVNEGRDVYVRDRHRGVRPDEQHERQHRPPHSATQRHTARVYLSITASQEMWGETLALHYRTDCPPLVAGILEGCQIGTKWDKSRTFKTNSSLYILARS